MSGVHRLVHITVPIDIPLTPCTFIKNILYILLFSIGWILFVAGAFLMVGGIISLTPLRHYLLTPPIDMFKDCRVVCQVYIVFMNGAIATFLVVFFGGTCLLLLVCLPLSIRTLMKWEEQSKYTDLTGQDEGNL